jgi:hypothetical protein
VGEGLFLFHAAILSASEEERKWFFFEKKNQIAASLSFGAARELVKCFVSFFQERNASFLLFFPN